MKVRQTVLFGLYLIILLFGYAIISAKWIYSDSPLFYIFQVIIWFKFLLVSEQRNSWNSYIGLYRKTIFIDCTKFLQIVSKSISLVKLLPVRSLTFKGALPRLVPENFVKFCSAAFSRSISGQQTLKLWWISFTNGKK